MVFLKKGSSIFAFFCLLIILSYFVIADSFSIGQVQVKPPTASDDNHEDTPESSDDTTSSSSGSGDGSKSSGTGFVFFIPGMPKTDDVNQVGNQSITSQLVYNNSFSLDDSSNSSNISVIEAEEESPGYVMASDECSTKPLCNNSETIKKRLQRVLIVIIIVLFAILVYLIISKRKKKR